MQYLLPRRPPIIIPDSAGCSSMVDNNVSAKIGSSCLNVPWIITNGVVAEILVSATVSTPLFLRLSLKHDFNIIVMVGQDRREAPIAIACALTIVRKHDRHADMEVYWTFHRPIFERSTIKKVLRYVPRVRAKTLRKVAEMINAGTGRPALYTAW